MTAARTITNAWIHRTLPDIFYEEPEPVEDGMLQDLPIRYLTRLLWERYEDRNDVFMSGIVFVSYDQRNGNARVSPDFFIAFGVDAAAIRVNLPNFWLWETGKAPDWVMEVASPSTAQNDLAAKRNLYAELGIAEYWRFDPTGGELYDKPLAGERLVDGRYVEYETAIGANGSMQAHSELLGVDFYWDSAGSFDILDPDTGRTIDRHVIARDAHMAEAARADAAEAMREAAEARAESEQQARLAAEERIRLLEAELERRQGS
jgi:Uma2 family endonuclease